MPRQRHGADPPPDAHGGVPSSNPCRKCGGTGRLIHQPCPDCHGGGFTRKRKTIKVSIPAGIDHGQTISLRGQGHAGKNGGPAGDLLVTVMVQPHDVFRRDGTAVFCEAPHHLHAGGAGRRTGDPHHRR